VFEVSVNLLFLVASFLIGSIPFGLLVGRLRGIDIRQQGSKNIGATNVGRVLGRSWGLLCFALDVLKGFLPTFAFGLYSGAMDAARAITIEPHLLAWWLSISCAAVFGHVFNPWLGFKGGKGVATSLGALLAVYPVLSVAMAVCFGVWCLCVALWRYVSLASILAAISLPPLVILVANARKELLFPEAAASPDAIPYLAGSGLIVAVTCILAGIIIWAHRSNIERLASGTESKVGLPRPRFPRLPGL
jgi:glycerol-3-phosphate acyltransferase PlsY